MSGSIFGKQFQISTWGESHGAGVGVIIDGCPAGLSLTEEDIQQYLNRRKPGQSKYTTPRKESDLVKILSGTFEGKTTGTPLSLMVENTNQHSKDYSVLANCYRPGHADYTFDQKYGFRDYRGGGRSSGRETIGRVAAGAVAAKLLKEFGIQFITYTSAIGPVEIDSNQIDLKEIGNNALFMPDATAAKKASLYLEDCIAKKDSAGGIITGIIKGVPAGIGEPVFDKLDAKLAQAIFSIGAVKGFEIGDGFDVSKANGSTNNDAFCVDEQGKITKATNHAGGILGGISDGSDICFRVAIKPTPSIASLQKTVTADGKETELSVQGRHDPVIVPRAVVVVEAMAALTLADLLLVNSSATLKHLHDIYDSSSTASMK